MKKQLPRFIEWCLIIFIVSVMFYYLFPKYQLSDNGRLRINTITGQVDHLYKNDKEGLIWKTIGTGKPAPARYWP